MRTDADRNEQLEGEGEISPVNAMLRTFFVAAREDIEIARQVRLVAAVEARAR